jgi:hypothetical protein
VTKTSEIKQFIRKKSLFWLTVSKVSVHGWLVTLLLGLGPGRTSWQDCKVDETALFHGGQEAKKRGAREEGF